MAGRLGALYATPVSTTTTAVTPSSIDGDRSALNLRWLIRLRWGAIAGQVLVIVGVERTLGLELALAPLFVIVGIEAASNVLVDAAFRRADRAGSSVSELAVAGVMALDLVLLTGLLQLSGGSFNPFNFLYLVHIALAAVVLPPRMTWSLVVLSLACFGSLFVPIDWGGSIAHLDHASMMDIHLKGMWVAFAVAALFITYFVGHVRKALENRDAELAAARERTARSERLASLATLAAGAAHELSTPLSTIHLVAAEMGASLERGRTAQVAQDAQLIREQVARCRDILEQMSDEAGASRGESPKRLTLAELVRRAVASVERPNPITIEGDDAGPVEVRLAVRATAQALKGLIDNACDASPPASPVLVRMSTAGGRAVITVEDRGGGMEEAVLTRAGEPFFTTKEPGKGMGLGLFLARTIAEEMGGELEIDSQPGTGTSVRLSLPHAEALSRAEAATSRRIADDGAPAD